MTADAAADGDVTVTAYGGAWCGPSNRAAASGFACLLASGAELGSTRIHYEVFGSKPAAGKLNLVSYCVWLVGQNSA